MNELQSVWFVWCLFMVVALGGYSLNTHKDDIKKWWDHITDRDL